MRGTIYRVTAQRKEGEPPVVVVEFIVGWLGNVKIIHHIENAIMVTVEPR